MTHNLDKDASWEHIIELSDSMQKDAAQEDWHAVATAAVTRHQLVNQHFEQFPVGPATAEYYFSRLNTFLANEQKLQQLAKLARKNIMRYGVEMQQGKKASKAYLSSTKAGR
ncbi:MAG: hypothetical protein WCY88_04405 [Spongiibacteraceae bacterium]